MIGAVDVKHASTFLKSHRFHVLATVGLAVISGMVFIPLKQANKALAVSPQVVLSDGVNAPKGMALIPGGKFLMGSDHKLSQINERPTHWVSVSGFWMDVTHVTNDQFSLFVSATHYITTAEKQPDWETVRVQLTGDAKTRSWQAGSRRNGFYRHGKAREAR